MRTIDSTLQFSHSLVNSYEGWLNAESDYNKYYGNSENAPDPHDYEIGKKLEFYSALFKVDLKPEFEREDTALMLGKDFEFILNIYSEIPFILEDDGSWTFENNKGDIYKVQLNSDFETLLENRKKNLPKQQVKIEGKLPNGLNFIGFADEVYDTCVIDIKTTSNFNRDNYNKSLQVPLYLHFLPYPITRGFYQVTEFYKSQAKGKNEFVMKDTFVIEAEPITEEQLREFAKKCSEILRLADNFITDFENYKNYFEL